jgi:hypothetical protein
LSFVACVIHPRPLPGAHILLARAPEDVRHDSVMFAPLCLLQGIFVIVDLYRSRILPCSLPGISSTSSSDPPLADS